MTAENISDRFKSFRKKIQKKLNTPAVHRVVHTAGKMGGYAVHLTSNTSPIGKAMFAVGALGTYMISSPHVRGLYPEYTKLDLNPGVVQFIFERIWGDSEVFKTIYESPHENVLSLQAQGESILFLVHANEGEPRPEAFAILYNDMDEDEALQLVGKAIWTAMDTDKILLKTTNNDMEMLVDPFDDSAPSAVADSVHERVKAYNDKGYHRSVLLVGPPGTGKSFAARRVAELRGGYSLRHSTNYASSNAIPLALQILKPQTLIFDDICRSPPDNDTVEQAKKACPLLIATANYEDKLDPALRRPGRFDEIIEVEALDDDAIKRMLPGMDFETAKRLATLPAAYLEEFRVTEEVHGTDAALERIDELTKRSTKLAEQTEIIDSKWADKVTE
jgi:hypothetical protein